MNALEHFLAEYVEHDLKRLEAVSRGDYAAARAKYRDMLETSQRAAEAGISQETLASEARRYLRRRR